jgi:hypothetical protein
MIGVMVLINLLGVRVFGEVEVRTGSNDMSGSSSAARRLTSGALLLALVLALAR